MKQTKAPHRDSNRALMIVLIILTILLVFSVSGVYANDITYNGMGSIIITGYNDTVGCTFQNVFDADQLNGWNLIHKDSDYEYSTSCMLQLGNNTHNGYFSDTNKLINIGGGVQYLFTDKGFGHLRLGEIANETYKTGKNGCIIYTQVQGSIFYITQGMNTLQLYDCTFKGIGGTIRVELKTDTTGAIWDCKFDRVYLVGAADGVDIHSLIVTMPNDMHDYGSYNFMAGVNGSIDKMYFYGAYYPFYIRMNFNNEYDVKNVVARDYKYLFKFYRSSGTFTVNAIDWDVIDWDMYFYRSSGCVVNRMYTFNLQTTPNARVTIMDKDSVVFSDYAFDNGTISEQIFNYGYYRSSGNVFNNPFTITIEKNGYHTYSQNFIIDNPVKWTIRLVPDRVFVGCDIIRPLR